MRSSPNQGEFKRNLGEFKRINFYSGIAVYRYSDFLEAIGVS